LVPFSTPTVRSAHGPDCQIGSGHRRCSGINSSIRRCDGATFSDAGHGSSRNDKLGIAPESGPDRAPIKAGIRAQIVGMDVPETARDRQAETPRPRRRSARQANGIGQPRNNSPAKGHYFCTKCLREATERSRNISTAIGGSLTSGSPNPRRNKPDAGAKSASGEADHRTHWTIGGESATRVHPAHARVPFPGALAPTFLIS